jgi:hypothetical protein
MNDEEKTPLGHRADDIGFEREDLSPKAIFAFLVGLALAGILVHYIITGLYGYLDAYERQHQPVAGPLERKAPVDTRVVTPGDVTKFPQPRLETDERTEINGFRLEEEQRLYSYGWVDKNAGIVHIPIERAMQIIAQQGLPTRPQTQVPPIYLQYEHNLAGNEYPPGPQGPVPMQPLQAQPAKSQTAEQPAHLRKH